MADARPCTGPAVTDARFPERWLNDRRVLKLSGDGVRLLIFSLAWSVSNRTDGVITDDDLPLIPHSSPQLAADLVATGLWQRREDRWLVADFADTQTTRERLNQLDAARRAERDRKAKQRASGTAHGTRTPDAPGDSPVPADVPGDVPPDHTGQDRLETGQDRKVYAGAENETGPCCGQLGVCCAHLVPASGCPCCRLVAPTTMRHCDRCPSPGPCRRDGLGDWLCVECDPLLNGDASRYVAR